MALVDFIDGSIDGSTEWAYVEFIKTGGASTGIDTPP
jgi:hypothetical protein